MQTLSGVEASFLECLEAFQLQVEEGESWSELLASEQPSNECELRFGVLPPIRGI